MTDSFDPYDAFDPESPFCDPHDPFLDPLHQFNDQPGHISDPIATSNMIQDPLPDHGVGFGTFSKMPWPGDTFPGNFAPDMETSGPSFGLDKPTGFESTGLGGLDSDFDNTSESPAGLDVRDAIDAREVFKSESYYVLDELEASIEQGEPFERGSENESDLSDEPQYLPRVFGMSSPELKIEHKPEKRNGRRFPVKLWKPRRYAGLRSSSISNTSSKKYSEEDAKNSNDEQKIRYCPARNGEVVTFSECESCEFFRDSECAWTPEEVAEAEDRES